MSSKQATPNWGIHFRIKSLGASTYYVVYRSTNTPVSPDFRERGEARRWIIKNWKDVLFEIQVLK